MMAPMAGMKLSNRRNGKPANGATALNATSVTTTTLNARRRCRNVGRNVAIERSGKSAPPQRTFKLNVSYTFDVPRRSPQIHAAHSWLRNSLLRLFSKTLHLHVTVSQLGLLVVYQTRQHDLLPIMVVAGSVRSLVATRPAPSARKRDLQHFVSDIVVARDRTAVVFIARSPPFTLDPKEVEKILGGFDSLAFVDVKNELRNRKHHIGDGAGEYEHRIPTALAFYFKWHNVTQSSVRACITVLAAIGYVLVLALPALDLLLKV